ncbi:MAG: YlxR family protein [Armatimonadetes bacterium]|nr:YlxR family protein [Armatimonadota bacterium]
MTEFGKQLRQCISCRKQKERQILIRVVRGPQGSVSVDLSGKEQGRGAYLCRDAACVLTAIKSRKLQKVLKTVVSGEVEERIREVVNGQDSSI